MESQRRLRLPRPGWGTLVVLAATASAMVWTYLRTHQIYPDTQFYLAWTYRLLGDDPATAERTVLDYIEAHAVFEPYARIFDWSMQVGNTRPRILLPLLSAPLVAAFGPGAIVVVPGIAFVVAMYLIYRFATVHASVPAAVAATCLALLSPLAVQWSVGGLTDSLALMLHAALFLVLPWRRPATWKTVAAAGVLTALTATARMITPFTVAAVAGLWLWAMLYGQRGRRWSWTAVSAGAAVGTLVGLVWTRWASAPMTTMTVIHLATAGEVRRYGDLLPWYAENLPGRIATEGGHILRSWPLALLAGLSLVACLTARRTVVPWLVVPAWLGALGVFMVNPVITVFRYELPVLPALVAAVAVLIDQAVRLAARARARARAGPDRAAPDEAEPASATAHR